ncbi:alkaline phosphatase [Taibaiella sp. KBW10]|uniref:DedA family protein n=1 Tax=Taibaiella sp. KBW10 TaxID=2153357 RepID=UPI000F591C1F|nr:VTT domain-containing protein [Taibaiella sp. KBW10]RQO31091.1 alkaline phosphatase [Taibaiella sp. KBW10]
MDVILNFFHNLTDPNWIINHGGYYIVLAIVFAETGLLLGFILPGDFLLFITGTIIAKPEALIPFDDHLHNMIFWEVMIILAAVLGNMVGYWFGKKSGKYLFERKDTWYFKKKHIVQAKDFYERKGGGAIIMARFLPVVRTFAPIVAGVVGMNYKKFMLYNVIGAVIWVGVLVTVGYFLGRNPWVERNLEYIVLGMVAVTTIPVLAKMIFGKTKPTDEVTANGKTV